MKSLHTQKKTGLCNEPPCTHYPAPADGHSFPILSPFTDYFRAAPRHYNTSFVNISMCISKRRILFCKQARYPLKTIITVNVYISIHLSHKYDHFKSLLIYRFPLFFFLAAFLWKLFILGVSLFLRIFLLYPHAIFNIFLFLSCKKTINQIWVQFLAQLHHRWWCAVH